MTTLAAPDDVAQAARHFTERCRALGLPVWRFAGGRVESSPSGWGPADLWFRAPVLGRWLEEAASKVDERSRARIVEVFPACWLVPITERTEAHEFAVTLVMVLAPEAFESEQFFTICSTAGIDAVITRTALSPLARHGRRDVDRLAAVLRWMHGDLVDRERNETALREFSRQLSETYEQISVLYQLGQAIHRLQEPVEYVAMACRLLRRALGFEWVAVRFVGRPPVGLRDRPLVLEGHLPCPLRRFTVVSGTFVDELEAGGTTAILDPGHHHLASLVDAPVVMHPIMGRERIVGALLAGNRRGEDADASSGDTQLMSAAAEFLASYLHSSCAFHEQRAMFLGTIRAISSTIDAKDRYTRGHSERVAYLASQLAVAAGLPAAEVVRVRLSGLLHDVGKIGVPESVLTKPGRLTDEEFEAIKRHPIIGYSILKDIEPLQDILPGVMYHHERWDGSGYPAGLAGDKIPLMARLLAVADMFDAMSSDRAYRTALERSKVLAEVEARAGTQLDPELATLFLTLDLSEYDRMIRRHLAQEAA